MLCVHLILLLSRSPKKKHRYLRADCHANDTPDSSQEWLSICQVEWLSILLKTI